MKLLLILITHILFCTIAHAQSEVNFILNEDGEYYTENDNQSFQIVYFDGMSSENIYNTLLSNINSIYNDPKIIVSKVNNTSIKIRAIFTDALYCSIYGVVECWVSANYQLEFRIKDGKVRVSAPFIEDGLTYQEITSYENTHTNKTSEKNSGYFSFRKFVSKQFKNGVVKKKYKKYHDDINNRMNGIINSILNNDVNNDW